MNFFILYFTLQSKMVTYSETYGAVCKGRTKYTVQNFNLICTACFLRPTLKKLLKGEYINSPAMNLKSTSGRPFDPLVCSFFHGCGFSRLEIRKKAKGAKLSPIPYYISLRLKCQFYDNCRNSRAHIGYILWSICVSERERGIRQSVIRSSRTELD